MVSNTTKGVFILGAIGGLFLLSQTPQEEGLFPGGFGYGSAGSNVDGSSPDNSNLTDIISGFLKPSKSTQDNLLSGEPVFTKKTINSLPDQSLDLSKTSATASDRFVKSMEGGAIIDRFTQQSFSASDGIKQIESANRSSGGSSKGSSKKTVVGPYSSFGDAFKVDPLSKTSATASDRFVSSGSPGVIIDRFAQQSVMKSADPYSIFGDAFKTTKTSSSSSSSSSKKTAKTTSSSSGSSFKDTLKQIEKSREAKQLARFK